MPRLSLLPVVALLASCAVAVDVVGSPGRDGGTPPADAAPRRDAGGPIRDAGAREDGGPRVVAPPVLREVRPAGPANQNRVEVAAAAAALATVELFSDPDCTVPLAAAVAAADGTVVFGVDVEDDSTTTFYALARIGDGPPSACAGGLTYVEDSTPPEPPRILESDPRFSRRRATADVRRRGGGAVGDPPLPRRGLPRGGRRGGGPERRRLGPCPSRCRRTRRASSERPPRTPRAT
jgi:hypothetical protein